MKNLKNFLTYLNLIL